MGLGLSKLIFFRFVWGATCLELKRKRPSDNGEEEKKIGIKNLSIGLLRLPVWCDTMSCLEIALIVVSKHFDNFFYRQSSMTSQPQNMEHS